MRDIHLTFSAWYGDYKIPIRFPRNWETDVCAPKWEPEIDQKRISESFEFPYGSERLQELAKGRRNAVVIVDCIARPTPASKILPFVVKELEKGGIKKSHIKIIIGTGAHRPLTAIDLKKKLGAKLAREIHVGNHNPFYNLTYLTKTSRGTPIHINTDVLKAELKVAVGCIIPHPMMGFGGGAKLILPGVAGIETMEYNHHQLSGAKLGVVEGNTLRLDAEEVAEKVGLDFIVNVTVNAERKMTRVFTGHFVKAHRVGVEYCQGIYKTELPDSFDILLANAYPLDVYLLQTGKALWAAERVEENGTIILNAACNEGFGIHYMVEKLRSTGDIRMCERHINRKMIIRSPNVGVRELTEISSIWHTKNIEALESWNSVFKRIRTGYTKKVRVAVLPCGSIQY